MILDAPSRANFYPTPWKLPRHASTGKPSTAIAVAGGFGKGTIAALGLGVSINGGPCNSWMVFNGTSYINMELGVAPMT